MTIPKISICSLHEAENRLKTNSKDYEYLISLGSPNGDIGFSNESLPASFDSFHGKKLRVEFDDIEFPTENLLQMGYCPPTKEDVRKIIEFCKEVDGPTLIHCAAGFSRSSATAAILIAIMK